MKWEKLEKAPNVQIAIGDFGRFIITKKRNLYYAKYIGTDKEFNLPPKRSIKELKQTCQDNWYWED